MEQTLNVQSNIYFKVILPRRALLELILEDILNLNNNLCDQTNDLIDSDRSAGETLTGELQTFRLIWSNEGDPRQAKVHFTILNSPLIL